MENKTKLSALIITITIFTVAASSFTVVPGEEVEVEDDLIEGMEVDEATPMDAFVDNTSLFVAPDEDFPPGNQTQVVEFEDGSSQSYDIQIEPLSNWTVQPENYSKEIDLGTTTQENAFNISFEGNTDSALDISSEGQVFEFTDHTDSINLVQGIDQDIFLNFQVQQDRDFGEYNGTLLFEEVGTDETQEVDIEAELLDRIDPVINDIDFPSYEATLRENMTVEASDNVGVDEVIGSVYQVVENESTGDEELQPYTDLMFESVENSDEWTVDTGIDRPGEYELQINVSDESNNTVSGRDRFTVEELDGIDLDNDRTLSIPSYRVGSQITEDIGQIRENKSYSFELSDFSHDLENRSSRWRIGLVSSEEGSRTFGSVGDTVEFDEPANLTLDITGETEADFDGSISVQTPQFHKEVDDLFFRGEYMDCPAPREQERQVFDRNLTFDPVDAETCEDAGWEMRQFIPASEVEGNQEEAFDQSLSMVSLEEIRQRDRIFMEERLDEKDTSIAYRNFALLLLLSGNIFLIARLYYMKNIYPYVRGFKPVKTSETKGGLI